MEETTKAWRNAERCVVCGAPNPCAEHTILKVEVSPHSVEECLAAADEALADSRTHDPARPSLLALFLNAFRRHPL